MGTYNKLPKDAVCHNRSDMAIGRWNNLLVCRKCYNFAYTYGILDNDKIKNKKIEYLIKKDKIKGKNRCCVCNKLTRCMRKEYKEGKHTGGWICENCRGEEYYTNTIKPMTDHRIGNIDPNSSVAKGDNFEELTSIWKRVKILSIENDKYCGPLDHSIDSNGKRPETKGKFYDPYNRRWLQDCRGPQNAIRRGFIFDYLILYCASKDGKDIDRIYEFPTEELMNRSCVNVIKNPMNHCGTIPIIPWYEKYRIIDEEELIKVNKIWKEIINKK